MEASVVDLRYKMNDVLKAVDRNEEVKILYHGKLKAIIKPIVSKKKTKMEDLPFFGMYSDDSNSVEKIMSELRRRRYDFWYWCSNMGSEREF